MCSPPASPGLRRSSPAYSMPGALLIDSSGGENDSEEESQEEDAGTIIDNNFGQIMTRLSTPNPTGFDNHGATTFPTASLALIQTEVPSPNCVCGYHLTHSFSTNVDFLVSDRPRVLYTRIQLTQHPLARSVIRR